ncbi:hypothetical protein MPSEU_000701400 [Mayamaea pseudoterrestris]|nr:hypothetical protein MPSEU_000701400 [Mayamaea pseudoterrestris]
MTLVVEPATVHLPLALFPNTMSSPTKRLNPDASSSPAKAKKGKVDVNGDDEDPQVLIGRQRLDLERLVTAMELVEIPPHSSWQSISMRGERAQTLWKIVAPHLTEQQRLKLEPRVQRVCQRANEISSELAKDDTDDPVQRIFYRNEQQNQKHAADVNGDERPAVAIAAKHDVTPTSKAEAAPPNLSATKNATSASTSTVPAPPSIQELQKTQREQMETAIGQMAAQMKEETAKIHSTLQKQTTGILAEMEHVATENVEQVTQVARDVKNHVSNSWKRSIGTWAMLFTIVGAFLFCLVTIQVAPKRPGACLFFCDRKSTKSGSHASVQASSKAASTCEMDVNGDCIAPLHADFAGGHELPRETERTLDQLGETSEQTERMDIYSSVDGMAEEALNEGSVETVNGDGNQGADQIAEAAAVNDLDDIEFPVDGLADDVLKEYMETVEAARNPTPDATTRPNANAANEGVDNDPFAGFEAVNTDEAAEYNGPRVTLTDVMTAAVKGDAELVKEYLAIDPSLLNQGDENRWTPLHLAAHEGHEAVVRVLLDIGADLDATTIDGKTPLDLSIERQGQDHAMTNSLRMKVHERQQFTASDLRTAAELNRIELVRGYLSVKPDLVNEGDENRWTALHLAARAGHSEVLQVLLAAGADAALTTLHGKMPIDIAVERLGPDHAIISILQTTAGQSNGMDTLANDDGDSDAESVSEDVNSDTAINQAEETNDEENADEIDNDTVDDDFSSSGDEDERELIVAIQSAAGYGDVDTLKAYLESHAHLKDATDENGWNALHVAASNGQVGALRTLLRAGCDPWAQNNADETPFDVAFNEYGDAHPVTTILKEVQSADLSDANDLLEAIDSGNVELVRSVVLSKPYLKSHEIGATALHQAVTAEQSECLGFLLENDWDPYLVDNEGLSVVDVADEMYDEDHPIMLLLGEYTDEM